MEEQKIIIEFGNETKLILNKLISAIEENTKVEIDDNPNEFAREVCANIYADMLLKSTNLDSFPYSYNP